MKTDTGTEVDVVCLCRRHGGCRTASRRRSRNIWLRTIRPIQLSLSSLLPLASRWFPVC